MKKIPILLLITLLLGACVPKEISNTENQPLVLDENLELEDQIDTIMAGMSLEEKAGQMVQAERSSADSNPASITGVGSVLSGGGSVPRPNTPDGWYYWIQTVQSHTMDNHLAIPSIYGIDAVHGHASINNATIFPHNIGLGAANDPVLMEQMGRVVAEEMFQTRVLWNFGPCVALAYDPRWGRSYESFSTDPDITAQLAAAYVKGFQGAGGVATAKHYLGDGQTVWGSGINNKIDQGDTPLSIQEIRESALIPYQVLIDNGVLTVMASFSSVEGLKMHEHKVLLTDILKEELGFQGFVISDWEAVQQLSPVTYEKQVWAAVNAGCDMLMEPYRWQDARRAIIRGVEQGAIPQERVDDAVRRILRVKLISGLFEDPLLDKLSAAAPPLRDPSHLDVARSLVEKSLVLLKNDNDLLPIRSGQTVLVLGPGADDIGLQCGGWTLTWQGKEDFSSKITEGTTILESLQALSEEDGFRIVTDPELAGEADMVLLVLAERPYAEYEGDSPSPALTGYNAHQDNLPAMIMAEETGLPIAAVILAGRQISIEDRLDSWDAAVMAYLPGTEGDGVGRVLTGQADFSGTLPMPWFLNVVNRSVEEFDILFPMGYGLTYEEEQ